MAQVNWTGSRRGDKTALFNKRETCLEIESFIFVKL